MSRILIITALIAFCSVPASALILDADAKAGKTDFSVGNLPGTVPNTSINLSRGIADDLVVGGSYVVEANNSKDTTWNYIEPGKHAEFYEGYISYQILHPSKAYNFNFALVAGVGGYTKPKGYKKDNDFEIVSETYPLAGFCMSSALEKTPGIIGRFNVVIGPPTGLEDNFKPGLQTGIEGAFVLNENLEFALSLSPLGMIGIKISL